MFNNSSRTQITKLLIVTLVVAFVAPLFPHTVSAQAAPQRYLVQISPMADRNTALAALNAQVVDFIPQLNVYIVTMDEGMVGRTRDAVASGLLTFAEPDGIVTGDLLVDDPALLDATMSYAQHIVLAPEVWTLLPETYREIVVAVVDTGLNAAHPEFAGRIVEGYDFVNFDADPTDDHGHGTHVAGIIAAGANSVGMVGVCPTCKIMPVKALNAGNSGTWSTVARGILYAIEHDADVINLSLGASTGSETVRQAIVAAQEAGLIVVAAAGNSGSTAPHYPAAYPGVIGVSATDNNDTLWPLSNRGENIDLAAPGYRIYSTYHDLSTGGYAYMTGTSMATPFVAGLAALVLAYAPTVKTADETVALMTAGADDLGDGGWDQLYGNGRINVCKTMAATLDIDASTCYPNSDVVTGTSIFLPVVTN